MNLLKVTQTFATEDQALDYLVKARWPKGVHQARTRYATQPKRQQGCDRLRIGLWMASPEGETRKSQPQRRTERIRGTVH